MMSNPATQNRTATARKTGGQAMSPRRAIQAATGARLSESPEPEMGEAGESLGVGVAQSQSKTGTERVERPAVGQEQERRGDEGQGARPP